MAVHKKILEWFWQQWHSRADNADCIGSHDRIFYQSLHPAYTPSCYRYYPQGLFRLIEPTQSATFVCSAAKRCAWLRGYSITLSRVSSVGGIFEAETPFRSAM